MCCNQMKVVGDIVIGFSNNPFKTKNYGSIYLCNSDSHNYCNCDDLELSGFKT